MKYFSISPSSLNLVMVCLQQYDYKKNHSIIYPRPQNHMMMGKLGHFGLQIWYQNPSLPNAERLELMAMRIREESMLYTSLDSAEKQAIFDAVRDYAIHYIGENWVVNPNEVEKPFSKILGEVNGVTVILEGKMDLPFHSVDNPDVKRVADHKFLWSKWPLIEINNQFMGYAFALGAKIAVHNAIYVYKKGAEFVRTIFSYDKEQLEEWQLKTVPYYMGELFKAFDSGYFPMNLTACDRYGGCQYRDICKVQSSIRKSVILTDYVKYEGEDLYD